ncbi:MAG: sugar phosphate isomerase/epimerase [Acidobacteriota bacterium]|nr:sugar phosphate isomerase/epimerase [Acidobacteriota bacterium]
MPTRRAALAAFASTLAYAAGRLPANKNVRWALGSNLWNYFPRVPFTDILDVMRDTGFIGVRVTQFPQILTTYNMTAEGLRKEVDKRGLHVITISFNGPAQDPARRGEVVANARKAMTFLKTFDANHLVVFSPRRLAEPDDAAFKAMCECFNEIGAAAIEMGFRAGLHNHLGQMVQDSNELDRCMAMTDPKLFFFSPDTAHLHLAGMDSAKTIDKYKSRLMLLDYKDARRGGGEDFRQKIFDLGDGEIDFPACHSVLKSIAYKGWICVDLDIARQDPRASYERCGAYVVNKLEPIYL